MPDYDAVTATRAPLTAQVLAAERIRKMVAEASGGAQRSPDWFRRQLDIAGARTKDWPDWARKEAGLPVGTSVTTINVAACQKCGYLTGPGLTCLCQVRASQATGWACPKCGCVWGPSVTGCERCNVVGPEESELDGTRRTGMWTSKVSEEDR